MRAGQPAAGSVLHSERDLQTRYGVSRSVVRQAFDTLEREGLIVRQRGRETRVAGGVPYVETLPGLRGFSEEMRQIGRTPEGKVLAITRAAPAENVTTALQLYKDEEVVCLHRLMLMDALPVVVFHSYLPAYLGVDLQADFRGSLYELLESTYQLPLREAWETIEAGGCPADAAELLGVQAGAPVLMRKRLTCMGNRVPVEYVEGVYHAERYRYQLHLNRQQAAPSPAATTHPAANVGKRR